MLKTIIRRVIITEVREGQIKRVDATGIAGETFLDRESFQHYGFFSTPVDDQAEGIMFGMGNVFYLIAEDDRRYRPPAEKGESGLYTDEGDKVHLKRNKEIHVISGGKVIVDAPEVEITGSTKVIISSPDVELGDGTLRKLIDERLVDAFNQHVHATAATGPPSMPTTPLVLTNVATAKTKAS